MIRLENLHKSFGDVHVLKGIDLNIDKGEIVAIVGPSGSGKSTVLRCMNLLEEPTNGKIIFEGENITDKKVNIDKIRQNIGMVFQNFNLFPHKSVIENIIEGPMRVLKKSKEQSKSEAREILSFLGLSEKEDSYPHQLSGGQKQRVAIGRALAMEPKLMCFDEPTSALDPELTEEVANVIKMLRKKGMTMLIITHDMTFAEKVASRIISMDNGEIVERHIYRSSKETIIT